MGQSTVVVIVPPAQRQALRDRLSAEAFEFRPVPHALFSVKGPELVATLYKSGKLVVQGSAPELFLERFVGDNARPARSKAQADPPVEEWIDPDVRVVGSDECGKGDYFGPLVVVAVRLEPDLAAKTKQGGVTDSKRLSDQRALRLGAGLRALVPHAVRRLDPVDYNRLYTRQGQLDEILADLHAAAIRELAEPGEHVLVDRFAKASLLDERLVDLDLELVQRPRAEQHPAVAAASVIAREKFLNALGELSEQYAIDLRKGAGPPVDDAAVEFAELHGFERLSEVAKLHFRNTEKVRRRCG